MDYTVSEVLRFVEENDVKFIKFSFCDSFGTLKNISVLTGELEKAFDSGIAFNARGINGFNQSGKEELYLRPDPGTLNVLPWRPHEGCVARLICEVVTADGDVYDGDTRNILKKAVKKLSDIGYTCEIGSECEFYLFNTDEYGRPTYEPQDYAGYLDVSPLDKGENVRRDICLTLEEMGIDPKTSHHEKGPGQSEIDFKESDALSAADDLTTFKLVVKAIAERNGVYASFMPKPLIDKSGSGMSINLSLFKDGANILKNGSGELSDTGESFLAGVLKHIKEITLFTNPLANSYDRFGCYEAPKNVAFSADDSLSVVRISRSTGKDAKLVLRSPDPSCNHYLAFALLIYAGIEGIENKLKLSDIKQGEPLPDTLSEAIDIAQNSEFIKKHLSDVIVDSYIKSKSSEWVLYNQNLDSKQSVLNSLFPII